MNEQLKSYLFQHRIFVNDKAARSENAFAVRYALAKLFGIRITEGADLLTEEMISFASAQLGRNVPEPFYKGFPDSVRALSPDQLLFDQIVHYMKTYGLGRFDERGHSIMEDFVERTAFEENTRVRDFIVVDESEAVARLTGYAENLLHSTRPLSEDAFIFLKTFIDSYDYKVRTCASKNTAMRLLLAFQDTAFAQFLMLSDVPKLAGELIVRATGKSSIRKLNLQNKDRKLITAVINALFLAGKCNLTECYEKKAVWSGLLHHIHYKPVNDEAAYFVSCMRGKENHSVYSSFERAMAAGDIPKAVSILKEGKGSGALLRRLDYILSRCRSEDETQFVLDQLHTQNGIILMQLLFKYGACEPKNLKRVFSFVKHNRTIIHQESAEEALKRKSFLSEETRARLSMQLRQNLANLLAGRLGQVYIDPDMACIAVPIQMAAASGGFGALPRGSRLPIEKGKKIRAFTYWEKVNDIDLSVIGLRADGTQTEFSWRTMADRQSDAITYSGDETSGYHGGSEYFDIDVEAVKKMYPDMDYLVFCDNVFSGSPFSRCICRAGYMLRDIQDSGQVFEPKTVQTSFTIDCESTFAYLFAIDLKSNDFIWLNTVRQSSQTIAGQSSLSYLTRYFNLTSVMNLMDLFSMMASEISHSPVEAEWIISDKDTDAAAAKDNGAALIRSCDIEQIMALMNRTEKTRTS